MACQSEVIHCYEQMAPLTEHMLMLASQGQWGDLPALEEQQSALVGRLRALEPTELLSESQTAHKYQLLVRIMAHQAEINGLVGPQLQELSQTLKSMMSQQLLQQAYGRPN